MQVKKSFLLINPITKKIDDTELFYDDTQIGVELYNKNIHLITYKSTGFDVIVKFRPCKTVIKELIELDYGDKIYHQYYNVDGNCTKKRIFCSNLEKFVEHIEYSNNIVIRRQIYNDKGFSVTKEIIKTLQMDMDDFYDYEFTDSTSFQLRTLWDLELCRDYENVLSNEMEKINETIKLVQEYTN